MVGQRHDRVRTEDRGLGGHGGVLSLTGAVGPHGLGDGPVDLLVAQSGQVVPAVAGVVAAEGADGVAGLQEAVAGADERVERPGERVVLQP
ncbi:hypothetical protein K4G64_32670 [Streptomyces sp. WAC04114]|nr:hypothetical protein [Streptomyces sp. WAC04114]